MPAHLSSTPLAVWYCLAGLEPITSRILVATLLVVVVQTMIIYFQTQLSYDSQRSTLHRREAGKELQSGKPHKQKHESTVRDRRAAARRPLLNASVNRHIRLVGISHCLHIQLTLQAREQSVR
ncbi:MAG TPA: hypothetical protein VK208_18875 [Pyrinomonadaceae bacterium]|nr:hypothetical protein [Pyrinomonadaceae bacterium]